MYFTTITRMLCAVFGSALATLLGGVALIATTAVLINDPSQPITSLDFSLIIAKTSMFGACIGLFAAICERSRFDYEESFYTALAVSAFIVFDVWYSNYYSSHAPFPFISIQTFLWAILGALFGFIVIGFGYRQGVQAHDEFLS